MIEDSRQNSLQPLYSRVMHNQALPDHIDPFALARKQVQLEGKLPIAKMSRLQGLINSLTGEAEVSLTFGVDEGKYNYIKGDVKATVELICQRCLQSFLYAINTKISLSPVKSDAECGKIPDYYEPLLMEEPSIALNTLVEEELVLSIPLIPKHPEGCIDLSQFETEDEVKEPNPFEVLKNFKVKKS